MVCLICQATFGNGVRIGMITAESGVFCGAVLGTTVQTACVLLTATATFRRLPATSSVFVVCVAWSCCFLFCSVFKGEGIMSESYIKASEAARRIGVSLVTAKRMVNDGRLVGEKVGSR